LKGRNARAAGQGLVCTSISARTVEAMARKSATAFGLGTDIVELRLDRLAGPTPEALERLWEFVPRSVLTVRRREEGGAYTGGEDSRLELLEAGCRAKPLFLDVELSTAEANRGWFKALPPGRRIVSWHDLEGTPSLPALRAVRRRAGSFGSLTKIVTTARSPGDGLRVLSLYESDPGELVAFCMGQDGTFTRVAALQMGSPIVYASLPGEPVAPGQLSVKVVVQLRKMLGERGR
jgi:3-dehydroquinate dehydratase-1